MKNKITTALLIASTLVLAACGGGDPTESVKGGTLDFDTSVTVGDALSGYDYFSETSWESFETSQGRTVVEFKGKINPEAYIGTTRNLGEWTGFEDYTITQDTLSKLNEKIQNLKQTYECQFSISKTDDSFEVLYSGVHTEGIKTQPGESFETDTADEDLSVLSNVYTNQPDPKTWAFIYLTAAGVFDE